MLFLPLAVIVLLPYTYAVPRRLAHVSFLRLSCVSVRNVGVAVFGIASMRPSKSKSQFTSGGAPMYPCVEPLVVPAVRRLLLFLLLLLLLLPLLLSWLSQVRRHSARQRREPLPHGETSRVSVVPARGF